MTVSLPELYFRVRDNGAVVFRVSTQNRERRIEMDQIAIVNTNRGDFKPHGDHELTATETAQITAWLEDRTKTLAARDLDDIARTIDHLNLTAQWAQSRASDADLSRVTDSLLMAMHDLRNVLVRKAADKLGRAAE